MDYLHLIAMALAIIATYFSFKAYALFGSKTKKWFIFTLVGFILLMLVHVVEYLRESLMLNYSAKQLMVIEHVIFYGAMIAFILSYYMMINSFKKILAGYPYK